MTHLSHTEEQLGDVRGSLQSIIILILFNIKHSSGPLNADIDRETQNLERHILVHRKLDFGSHELFCLTGQANNGCIHIHTHTHTHTHIYRCIYTHELLLFDRTTKEWVHIYTYIHTHIYIYIYIYICRCIYTHELLLFTGTNKEWVCVRGT